MSDPKNTYIKWLLSGMKGPRPGAIYYGPKPGVNPPQLPAIMGPRDIIPVGDVDTLKPTPYNPNWKRIAPGKASGMVENPALKEGKDYLWKTTREGGKVSSEFYKPRPPRPYRGPQPPPFPKQLPAVIGPRGLQTTAKAMPPSMWSKMIPYAKGAGKALGALGAIGLLSELYGELADDQVTPTPLASPSPMPSPEMYGPPMSLMTPPALPAAPQPKQPVAKPASQPAPSPDSLESLKAIIRDTNMRRALEKVQEQEELPVIIDPMDARINKRLQEREDARKEDPRVLKRLQERKNIKKEMYK